jgi:Fe2+ or Zn2+ uptake regulation protein
LINEHGPFSAEELHQRLPAGECDLVTVYRSLGAMEEINVVRRCDFGDGTYRYEINNVEHHHHHIICRECRSVRVIDLCLAESLERMARDLGYANVTHMLEIFGTCPECQRAGGDQR